MKTMAASTGEREGKGREERFSKVEWEGDKGWRGD
jgi:hypothetical protein